MPIRKDEDEQVKQPGHLDDPWHLPLDADPEQEEAVLDDQKSHHMREQQPAAHNQQSARRHARDGRAQGNQFTGVDSASYAK